MTDPAARRGWLAALLLSVAAHGGIAAAAIALFDDAPSSVELPPVSVEIVLVEPSRPVPEPAVAPAPKPPPAAEIEPSPPEPAAAAETEPSPPPKTVETAAEPDSALLPDPPEAVAEAEPPPKRAPAEPAPAAAPEPPVRIVFAPPPRPRPPLPAPVAASRPEPAKPAPPQHVAARPAPALVQTAAEAPLAVAKPAPPASEQSAGLPGNDAPPDTVARPSSGNPPPSYPRLARRRGLEGRLVLRVSVDAGGRAGDIEVIESSGHRLLDDSALKAVAGWRFTPARRGGIPVASRLDIPVNFRLKR